LNTINQHNYMKPKILRTSLTMLFIITLFSAPSVHAHKGATGVIKERMDMMGKIGKDMKGIKSMMQNKKPYSADQVIRHAESIHQASKKIKNSFPEGSMNHPSEALPSIWKNWKDFSSLADQLTLESERLKEIAATRDKKSVMLQFGKLGKTCRNCHTDFRKKKKKK
jgi:cytochrome c556